LSVTFTPADGADYTTATATVQVVVLAPGVTVIGSQLYLVGGNTSNDLVQVNPAGSSNTGSTGVKLNARLNGVNIRTTYSQSFTTIDVFLQGGNDNIQLAGSLTINAVVTAGNGNDNVQLGNGDNTVTLGKGNDNIQAGNGNNTVTAGGGNDNVTLGNGGNTVTLGNGNDNVQAGNGNNVVVTGNGNDNILTGNGNNLIAAGLGHHTVRAGNGRNILIDGSVQLTESGDSLRQVLDDWTQYGALTDDVANILARLKVTYNTRYANTLDAGAGLDWFWEIYGQDRTNRKVTDLLN
jgi:Ca2+-binding RTX toxin-like protein